MTHAQRIKELKLELNKIVIELRQQLTSQLSALSSTCDELSLAREELSPALLNEIDNIKRDTEASLDRLQRDVEQGRRPSLVASAERQVASELLAC